MPQDISQIRHLGSRGLEELGSESGEVGPIESRRSKDLGCQELKESGARESSAREVGGLGRREFSKSRTPEVWSSISREGKRDGGIKR